MKDSPRAGYDLERAVGSLLDAAGVAASPQRAGLVDFAYETADGQRVGIEVKSRAGIPPAVLRAREFLKREFDLFLLVTPEPPKGSDQQIFERALGEVDLEAQWVTPEGLQRLLGIQPLQDIARPNVQAALAAASIARSAGLPPGALIDPSVIALSAHLPPPILAKAAQAPSLNDFLRLGRRQRDVTFLVTDLVNFSTIVKEAAPDDLAEGMARYYRAARAIVFDRGGTLDKFMGDGVLAVFDYPELGAVRTARAVRCAIALVHLGRGIVDELLMNISRNIESGTRAALANGDLWAVESGSDVAEAQLLSDAINLAARLQTHSPVDGLVLERRAHVRLAKEDPTLDGALRLQSSEVPMSALKGQTGPIEIWTSSAQDVALAI
jgi:class 3 adenylate cyclase